MPISISVLNTKETIPFPSLKWQNLFLIRIENYSEQFKMIFERVMFKIYNRKSTPIPSQRSRIERYCRLTPYNSVSARMKYLSYLAVVIATRNFSNCRTRLWVVKGVFLGELSHKTPPIPISGKKSLRKSPIGLVAVTQNWVLCKYKTH